jgi:acetyltransferase
MVTTNLNLTVAGEPVTIRPIRVTDAAMEAEFVRKLSPQTKHYRFFCGVRELSPTQAKLFCEVDGRHSMAFVATAQRNGCETEIGVGRYAPNSKADIREMAVTIADEWQDKGLGKLLVKQLYSVELADRTSAVCALALLACEIE